MPLVVQKFGGTSVATAARLREAAKRVAATRERGNDVIVVVSARGDTTDELIDLAHEITAEPSRREMDMLVSVGEQMSIALMAMAIESLGHPAISFTGAQAGIETDSYHTKAKIVRIRTDRIRRMLRKNHIVIVAGFQGVDADFNITTLGRGGSDTTAVALAAALKADLCEIYTDVEGVYTADPRVVPNARKLDEICYDEMLELASTGAVVLQLRSVEVAKKFHVPLCVRSSFSDRPGTTICEEVKEMEEVVVRGAALDKNQAKITIKDVPDRPGQAAKIFRDIAKNNINIDMIIQNTSDNAKVTDLTFTVHRGELKQAVQVAETVAKRIKARGVVANDSIAKLSVVGVGMMSHCGVAEKMFSALAKNRVNIEMISTSEIKISCVINRTMSERALKAVHRAFELHKKRGGRIRSRK